MAATPLVVVDNGTGALTERALRDAAVAELVAVRENIGFAGGANLGIRRALAAGADFVLLLNNDAMLEAVYRALKRGGLLALIDGAAEPGRPRDEYYERHRMPAQTEREDAERNGFRFVRERPGFTRADDKKEYYFMIFEKPAKTI